MSGGSMAATGTSARSCGTQTMAGMATATSTTATYPAGGRDETEPSKRRNGPNAPPKRAGSNFAQRRPRHEQPVLEVADRGAADRSGPRADNDLGATANRQAVRRRGGSA